MSRSLLVASALVLSISLFSPAYAEDLPPRTSMLKILVPVKIGEFPGVGGSLWKNELWIHNDNEVEARVFRLKVAPSPCPPLCGGSTSAPFPEPSIPPHSTVKLPSTDPAFFGQLAEFLYVDRTLAPKLFCELRTHDESRNTMSAGTELPVIAETASRRRIELLSVPVSPNVRLMLRVFTFGYDDSVTPDNHIRYYDADSGALLAEAPLHFHGFEQEGTSTYTYGPYPNAILLDLASDTRLATSRAVRIELESSSYSFWAFISATNNVSQEVTVISPSPFARDAAN